MMDCLGTNFISSCLTIQACIERMVAVTSARERCYECESEFPRMRTDDSDLRFPAPLAITLPLSSRLLTENREERLTVIW